MPFSYFLRFWHHKETGQGFALPCVFKSLFFNIQLPCCLILEQWSSTGLEQPIMVPATLVQVLREGW